MQEFTFTYQQFEDLVRTFSEKVPELLLRHQVTAPLAIDIRQMRLLDALSMRFTVAIIGQMRVGKSTLLNAIIGKPLAPTGVTETTATVNWFRYGTDNSSRCFRVHWCDGSAEDVPMERVDEWIGDKDNAKRTASIDFFADADFLKTANIVDTPGTRSVLDSHEQTTQGFLAEKVEQDSLRYGGRADAVVYAINPVGREADSDLLKLFGDNTRLPGASPYNSIVVVQKWEHLEPDPLDEVQAKCARLRTQLEGKVAEVIPTSGLLAGYCCTLDRQVLEKLAVLANCLDDTGFRQMLLSEKQFKTISLLTLPLSPQIRCELLQLVDWRVVPGLLRIARHRKAEDADSLRKVMLDASGIECLKNVLQERFFSRAKLIKASTTLRKAWGPCRTALLRFRQIERESQSFMALGEQSLEDLDKFMPQDTRLSTARSYIQHSIEAVKLEIKQVSTLQDDLDNLVYRAERDFELLDRDVQCLEVVAEIDDVTFSDDDRRQIRAICGQDGTDVYARLAASDEPSWQELHKRAENMLYYWQSKRGYSSHALQIREHIITRLTFIVDFLEKDKDEQCHSH